MVVKKKILIIDKSVVTLERLGMVLESYGFEVHTSSTSAEGLRYYNQLRPDLVLTEILMPEMDGFELIRQMKRAD